MNDEDDDCWFNLYTLTQTQGVSSIIVWIIRLLKPGLIRHAPGTLFSSILFNMFEHESLELEELAFEIFEKRIQALPDYNEFSLLSQCLLNAKYGAITGLISKGANIHCTGKYNLSSTLLYQTCHKMDFAGPEPVAPLRPSSIIYSAPLASSKAITLTLYAYRLYAKDSIMGNPYIVGPLQFGTIPCVAGNSCINECGYSEIC
jgi:hypothetical protein